VRCRLENRAAGAGDAHEEVAEALIEPFDVTQHAHARMVRSGAERVYSVRDSVPTCTAYRRQAFQVVATVSMMFCDTSVV
jgi:hypothetical protein